MGGVLVGVVVGVVVGLGGGGGKVAGQQQCQDNNACPLGMS